MPHMVTVHWSDKLLVRQITSADPRGEPVARPLIFNRENILPRNAILARYMLSLSVCPSVCLSQAGTVPKQLNTGSRKQHNTIAHISKMLFVRARLSRHTEHKGDMDRQNAGQATGASRMPPVAKGDGSS